MSEFEIKGRHVAMMFVGGFAVIIGVNVVMATQAVRTFPGLETKNSYVASQVFDRERAAQDALGWDVAARIEDGTLRLTVDGPDGRPAAAEITSAVLGRATHVADDRALELAFDGQGFAAPVPGLAPGKWSLRLEAVAEDGTPFRQRLDLWVNG